MHEKNSVHAKKILCTKKICARKNSVHAKNYCEGLAIQPQSANQNPPERENLMKILFMGTPDFASASLEALVNENKYDISVITQPDKPKGRGYIMTPPHVKVTALRLGLPVYQPETLKGDEFSVLLNELSPDIIIVVAYGKLLPKNVLDYPKFGCINVHGSLLPKYRGAAPIQRAIIDGEPETGITIMYMNEGLDTGDMLTKERVSISDGDNFETLFDRLAAVGAELLVKTLPKIISGEITPEKQDSSLATYANKIEKSDCFIDFSSSAKNVHNRIRGLSPFPLAYTVRGGLPLKLICSEMSDISANNAPSGCIVSLDGGITVACGDNSCIKITELLPAGKKRMLATDYLRGNKLTIGESLID